MRGKWKKLGRIYDPTAFVKHPALLSHASNPVPVLLNEDTYRIFFSARDVTNRSSVGFFDFDLSKNEIVSFPRHPALRCGGEGTFYRDGVSLGNYFLFGKKKFLSFMGWRRGDGGNWCGEVGLIEIKENWQLEYVSCSPILGVSDDDAISLSYPFIYEAVDSGLNVIYGATDPKSPIGGALVHCLRAARSEDGRNWVRRGVVIPYRLGVAQAFSRPCVLADSNHQLHMWFSFRAGNGSSYRIGYARLENGNNWITNIGEVVLDVSATGWDSEMVEYPYVFRHREAVYMLYNGNGFGRTGIGLAKYSEIFGT